MPTKRREPTRSPTEEPSEPELPMKHLSASLIPELDGWRDRLSDILSQLHSTRTIGKLTSRGEISTTVLKRRTQNQKDADFWFRVDVKDDHAVCWLWKHGQNGRGYGVVSVNGKTSCLTHRVASAFRYGIIPDSLCACHHCDNPLCCNPSHLFISTPKGNTGDMIQKGRLVANPRFINAKLDFEKAEEIRRRFQGGESMSDLKDAFFVTRRTIRLIVRNKRWTHNTL